MRKLISYSFAASLLIISSCSEEVTTNNTQSESLENNAFFTNATATIEVEGMTCEMGCGAEIRKHLKATNAVESCSFDFIEGRDVNTAVVKFDNTKTDANELAEIIRGINDNQFKTHKVSAKTYDINVKIQDSDEYLEGSLVGVCEGSYEFPNIFEFISGFGL